VKSDAGLSSSNPRDVDLEAAAELDGGRVQVGFGDCGPKVPLVSRRTALETAKRISGQMNRDNATLGGCRAVDRAWPAQLVAVSLRRDEGEQFEYVLDGNLFPNNLVIDARQERFSWERCPRRTTFDRIVTPAQRRGTRRHFVGAGKRAPQFLSEPLDAT
jgi:hypothetical protein